MPDFELRYKELGSVKPSAVTAVSRGFLDRAIEAKLPGVVIAVCDYTREALSFAVSKAIENVLGLDPDLDIEKDELSEGTPICIGQTVVEYLGISERDQLGKMLEYRQPDRRQDQKSPVKSYYSLDRLPTLHRCIEGTVPTLRTRGSLKDTAVAFSALPEIAQMLRNRSSSVVSPVAVATSASPYLNIPPTVLKSAEIFFGNEGLPLAECLTTGRFSDGEIKRGNSYPAVGEPSIVVTSRTEEGISELLDLYEYLDEGGTLDSIVLEAPTAECIDSMRGLLEDIINEFGVPVAVFCEEGILRRTNVFDELGFPVFIWGKSQLLDVSGYCGESHLSLTRRELCAANSVIRCQPVEDDGRFSEAARILYGLADRRNKLSEGEQVALLTLTRVLGQALRQTEMLDESASSELRNRIDGANAVLTGESSNYSLTKEEMHEVEEAAKILRSLSLPDVALPKENAVYGAIVRAVKNVHHKVCLVVSNGVNERTASEYWKEALAYDGLSPDAIRVIAPRRFLKQDSIPEDEEVFISGWFRREEMERLLGSGLAGTCTVFMYRGISPIELETQWYLSADDYWKRHHKSQKSRYRKSLERIKVTIPKPIAEPEQDAKRVQDKSLSGIARSMERERNEWCRTNRNGEEAYRGRPVWFTSGVCRWLRVREEGGDSLIVVTDALDPEIGYCRKTVAGLQEGDIVLRTESDDDALDEACNAHGLREVASRARAWREPIDEALRFMSRRSIRDRISKAGCKRNLATIARWVNDSSIIAPSEKEDIAIIGKALNREFTDSEINEIMKAASTIRGDRITSGRKLIQEIAEAFVKDARAAGSLEEAADDFCRKHGDMGSVDLLFVEYIGDLTMVPAGRFGWCMG
ncbi:MULTISPECIES: DrmE family protein [unclassified Adlercreutzia]|uniref:DrmE family protein n=1 Tax=unclassified Adlercreutzia TaxID=2636013 RepID=UPI0013ED580D|nr:MULTISPECIES: DrmE family protein [unclassified Adlercreutzia]